MAENPAIRVEKRDGTEEAFRRDKVKNSIIKAGASTEEAEKVTAQIESWAQEAAVEGVIKTLDIRAKVIEKLTPVNLAAAKAYEAYRKPTA